MEYNPFSPEIREDPYPVYRRLRDEAPAHYNAQLDFWTLSRFADVTEALQHPEIYCSGQGIGVGMSSEMAEMFPTLIMTDPPRHGHLRALVNRAFTPRRIAGLEERIRGIAVELVEQMQVQAGQGARCDLVRDFSAPLPTIVIAELLGVPVEDQKMFKERSNALINQEVDPKTGLPADPNPVAAMELVTYLNRIYDEREKEPREDLMTALLHAEIEGERLTRMELNAFALLLLVAGNETTTNLISNGAVLLNDHPDQREKLRGDPAGIPWAIEEFLRFESPISGIGRTLTTDVELHGQKMEAGKKVLLLYGAANRDERQFEEPDRFDTTRKPTQHLGFGFGTHFCLGASLARLEARVAFEELLARMPGYTADTEAAQRNPGGIRGFASLPIQL